MKTRIIRIGKSRGIRIPRSILEAAGLEDEVDLTIHRGVLMVRPVRQPVRRPRVGWAEAFQEMARRGDDEMLIP